LRRQPQSGLGEHRPGEQQNHQQGRTGFHGMSPIYSATVNLVEAVMHDAAGEDSPCGGRATV
jgi:hypothetical protein